MTLTGTASFYMTWSTLVLSQPPLKVEILGILGIRIVFFLLPALVFLLFDSILPSLAVNIKHQGASSLPTRTGGLRISAKSASRPAWLAVLVLATFNILLSTAIQSGIDLLHTSVFHTRSMLKITTTLPMPWSIATDVLRSLLLREVLQYYIHRYLLHPARPTRISRLHSKYAHAVTAPFALVAHYDHPVPYLLHRFLPLYLPVVLFRTHLLTHLLLLALVTLEETLGCCGYTTLPGILIGGIARRQDLHYQCRGKGNYAPWGMLDWIHGTGVGRGVDADLEAEAEKHHVKERGQSLLENAGQSAKAAVNRKRGKKA